ncbi:MAG: GAF domain-containing protein [Bacteroidales bacterium]
MESLSITSNGKENIYKEVIPQIKSITCDEPNLIANMANVSAILKEAFNFWWVGFYLVDQTELVLGPFQGTLACTRIKYGRGVCGTAWKEAKTIIVKDVEQFPGHIACSSLSRSEIVIPIFNSKNKIFAVLDIDSKDLNTFDNLDAQYLKEVTEIFKATL